MLSRDLLRSPAIRPQQTTDRPDSTSNLWRTQLRTMHFRRRLLDDQGELFTLRATPCYQPLHLRGLTITQPNPQLLVNNPSEVIAQTLPFTLDQIQPQIENTLSTLHQSQQTLFDGATLLEQDVNHQLNNLLSHNSKRLESNIATFNTLQHKPMICAPAPRPAIKTSLEPTVEPSPHIWPQYRVQQEPRELPKLPKALMEQLDEEFPIPAQNPQNTAIVRRALKDQFHPSLQCAQSAYISSMDALLDMAELYGDLTYNYLQGMRRINQHSQNLMAQGNHIQALLEQLPHIKETPVALQQERRVLAQTLRQANDDICSSEWFDNIKKMRELWEAAFERSIEKIRAEMGQIVEQHSAAGSTMFTEVADSIFNGHDSLTEMHMPTAQEVQQAFETLGLPSTATRADVKKKFRALSRQYHPDKLTAEQATRPDLQSHYQTVMTAYQRLMRVYVD